MDIYPTDSRIAFGLRFVFGQISARLSDEPWGLEEGWYLMSTGELERALQAWRGGDAGLATEGLALSNEEALTIRNAGNVPDDKGRSLRLILVIEDSSDLERLSSKRLTYEPDFHSAPSWRRPGSRPVNVVPLRRPQVSAKPTKPWWQDPAMKDFEEEWRRTGAVSGVRVPASYRSFVYKTVVALRNAGTEITAAAIADSISRWVPPAEAERIRAALEDDEDSYGRRPSGGDPWAPPNRR